MEILEKCIDSENKYKGIIVNVRLDDAELLNGAVAKREVVEHPGGVAVLPVDENGICHMVRQFRYPFSRMLLEAPAGKLETGERPEDCARRELSEETGFTADKLVYLGSSYASPGYLTEVIYIYLATGLHSGKSHPDENEFLNVEKHSLKELVELVMNDELRDAKTAIAVLKADKYLKEYPSV